MKKKESVVVSGTRKKAIARAKIKPGTGKVKINHHDVNTYDNEFLKLKIKEPLIIAGETGNQYNYNIKVTGGGAMSQAEAVRLTIAKGIIKASKNEELRKKYIAYDRNLLVADSRRTEPQKPCRSSARRGKQTSKR